MKKIFSLLVLLASSTLLVAQSSPTSFKKIVQKADEFFEQGNYQVAGNYYYQAWQEKNSKSEYAYKAGDCYYRVRLYRDAAECFEKVKTQNTQYDTPGYKYALCLKQAGDYEHAIQEFQAFINSYNGAKAAELKPEAKKEIEGCEWAKQMINAGQSVAKINILPSSINSEKAEFAPVYVDENTLYYSSIQSGVAAIYQSKKENGIWSKGVLPKIFKNIEKSHFGNGSFTPNKERFYFTQCDIPKNGSVLCAIYVIEQKGDSWSEPTKLPEYINARGFTNSQPSVTVIDGKEYLFFSSNRDAGQGGMDIWYSMRDANSSENNYTAPVNLGAKINTPKDEVTPYYHTSTGELYFSSNGHVNMGGLDVFKTKGNKTSWDVPLPLSVPINTCADELFFSLIDDNKGYFVSNRIYEPSKKSTANDDIFEFFYEKEDNKETDSEVVVRGKILEGNKLIDEATVKLINRNGDSEVIDEILTTKKDGEYYFLLAPNTKYRVEASKTGFLSGSFELVTTEFSGAFTQTQDISVIAEKNTKTVESVASAPPKNTEKTEPTTAAKEPPTAQISTQAVAESGNDLPEKSEKSIPINPPRETVKEIEKATPPTNTKETITEKEAIGEKETITEKENIAPQKENIPVENPNPPTTTEEEGTVYKIQLAAVQEYRPSFFANAEKMGSLEKENVADKGMVRILIGKYTNLEEARVLLNQLKANGYPQSFIAKYTNGMRDQTLILR